MLLETENLLELTDLREDFEEERLLLKEPSEGVVRRDSRGL